MFESICKNKNLYLNCTTPITDINKIRNSCAGVYLSLVDNTSVSNEVFACLEDILIHTGRIQKWFINESAKEKIEC